MDYSSLTRRVTSQELRQHSKTSNIMAKLWGIRESATLLSTSIFIAGMLIVLAGTFMSGNTSFVSIVLPVLIVGGVMGGLFVYANKRAEREFRLKEFAARNGMSYSAWLINPTLNGMIFSVGDGRVLGDWLRDDARRFAVGNYMYSTGSGKNRQTHEWGYLAIPLKRNLPHMVLDAKSNNTNLIAVQLSNLPVSFTKDQVLALEGDFNKYFTLYAPKEYERDALYVFAPDLMALLIDHSAQYDVELVDNTMYIYGTKFNLLDPVKWEHLMRIVETVGKKTDEQTKLYVDEKVGTASDDSVAVSGRQLKRGVSVWVVASISFFAIFFLFQIVGALQVLGH